MIIKFINENVDIPNLDEAEEAKLFDRVYLALIEAINKIIERI